MLRNNHRTSCRCPIQCRCEVNDRLREFHGKGTDGRSSTANGFALEHIPAFLKEWKLRFTACFGCACHNNVGSWASEFCGSIPRSANRPHTNSLEHSGSSPRCELPRCVLTTNPRTSAARFRLRVRFVLTRPKHPSYNDNFTRRPSA